MFSTTAFFITWSLSQSNKSFKKWLRIGLIPRIQLNSLKSAKFFSLLWSVSSCAWTNYHINEEGNFWTTLKPDIFNCFVFIYRKCFWMEKFCSLLLSAKLSSDAFISHWTINSRSAFGFWHLLTSIYQIVTILWNKPLTTISLSALVQGVYLFCFKVMPDQCDTLLCPIRRKNVA